MEISDPDAHNLDQAFKAMWEVAAESYAQKPLHHISINPEQGERLTDEQVQFIVQRCESSYGYRGGSHQRVIVEHIKEGRQHFHVMWNRISLETGKAVWPGLHWNKSKQTAREVEMALNLKSPTAKPQSKAKLKRKAAVGSTHSTTAEAHDKAETTARSKVKAKAKRRTKAQKYALDLPTMPKPHPTTSHHRIFALVPFNDAPPVPQIRPSKRSDRKQDENQPAITRIDKLAIERAAHIAWAFRNRLANVLAQYGIRLGDN